MNIRQKCLKMDGKCLLCGITTSLSPHHIIPTSQGGPDEEWNIISLCEERGCHRKIQNGYWDINGIFHTAKECVIKLLESYKSSPRFRWQKALDWWKSK